MRLTITALAGASLLASLLLASPWNKKTELTVNETLVIPGATLSPGKYVMKLVDSDANRNIVQVLNEREDKVITTIIAIPNSRLQPTGDTQFGYWETPRGTPRALRSWFYPGDSFGQEFAYPKDMAERLRTANNNAEVPVLSGSQREELAGAGATHGNEQPGEYRTERTENTGNPRASDTARGEIVEHSQTEASRENYRNRESATSSAATSDSANARAAERARGEVVEHSPTAPTRENYPNSDVADNRAATSQGAGQYPSTDSRSSSVNTQPERRDPALYAQNQQNRNMEQRRSFGRSDELPQTASPIALFSLLGLALAGAGFSLRRKSRR